MHGKVLSLGLAAGLLAGCAATGPPAATVAATDAFGFVPARVTITAGGAVVWRNASPFIHTVTDDSRIAADPADSALPPGATPFSSGDLAPRGRLPAGLSGARHLPVFLPPA